MHDDFLTVANAVRIRSYTSYSVASQWRDLGAMTGPRMSGMPALPEMASERAKLIQALESDIYSQLYTRPSGAVTRTNDLLGQRDHVNALSAANSGSGTWEPGWRIGKSDEEGLVAVSKDAMTFWVDPRTGLRTSTGRVQEGGWCRVHVAKEIRNLMPGFYFAIGNGDQSDTQDHVESLVRFYWNLTSAGASAYIAAVTSILNTSLVPFRTKVLSDPQSYVRADGGVLYLERKHFHRVRAAVLQVHRAVAPYLRDDVPMFTKRLAPGLGLAEDPGVSGVSFGMSRARALAVGLVEAFDAELDDVDGADARLAKVHDAVVADGIDPERPWLHGASADIYLLDASSRADRRAAELAQRRQERKERKIRP